MSESPAEIHIDINVQHEIRSFTGPNQRPHGPCASNSIPMHRAHANLPKTRQKTALDTAHTRLCLKTTLPATITPLRIGPITDETNGMEDPQWLAQCLHRPAKDAMALNPSHPSISAHPMRSTERIYHGIPRLEKCNLNSAHPAGVDRYQTAKPLLLGPPKRFFRLRVPAAREVVSCQSAPLFESPTGAAHPSGHTQRSDSQYSPCDKPQRSSDHPAPEAR